MSQREEIDGHEVIFEPVTLGGPVSCFTLIYGEEIIGQVTRLAPDRWTPQVPGERGAMRELLRDGSWLPTEVDAARMVLLVTIGGRYLSALDPDDPMRQMYDSMGGDS